MWREEPDAQRDRDRGQLIGGAATLGVCAAMALTGVALGSINTGRIAVRPRAPELTIGPGSVSGTF